MFVPTVDEVVLANAKVCASSGGIIGITKERRQPSLASKEPFDKINERGDPVPEDAPDAGRLDDPVLVGQDVSQPAHATPIVVDGGTDVLRKGAGRFPNDLEQALGHELQLPVGQVRSPRHALQVA